MRKCSKPDGNKNWVGKRIAELRKERGMSQNDLAIKLQNCGGFDGGFICGHSARY